MDSEPLIPHTTLYREQGRFALIAGYIAIWLLMTLLSVAALGYMASIQGQLREIVSNHYHKKELVRQMHMATRERVFGLQNMLLLDDPFERDAEHLKIQQNGVQFTQARDQFMEQPLEPAEKEVMEKHAQLARLAGPAQLNAIELVMNDEIESSRQILLKEVLPIQQSAMSLLRELEEYQDSSIKLAFQQAQNSYENARRLLIVLGGFATLLLMTIAFKVFRIMRFASQALQDEKDRLRVILHSIGDGVIATDHGGVIEYINPVAEIYTGWSRENARGVNVFNVFRISKVSDEKPMVASINELIDESHNDDLHHHSLLHRRDDTTLSVDYTASAIRHKDGGIGGYVLVFRDESKLREMAHHLSYQATHDPLTNLANRREFEHRLELLLKQAEINNSNHVLCYLDLDHFKIVNDRCGHAAGDEVLKQVVNLFRQRVRSNDLLARIGGDEFGLLLENCPVERALGITEEIRKSIHHYRFIWEGQSFQIGVSIGMVAIDSGWKNLPELLAAADAACYAAKDGGRNRIHLYLTANADSEDAREESWPKRLRIALEQDRLIHYYQQPISLQSSTPDPHYIDLQLRIMEQGRQRLPLAPLLPHVERHGLAPHIDRWAVEHALKLALLRENHSAIYSVPLSAASLQDWRFVSDIETMAEKYVIQTRQLCLEIPEASLLANTQQTSEALVTLIAKGFRIALNGTGQSFVTVDVLRTIPFDYLRMSGDFIHEAMGDPILQIHLDAIVRMARSKGMRIMAMDIQSHQLLEQLGEMGVDFISGHGIDKPQPAIALLISDMPEMTYESRRA